MIRYEYPGSITEAVKYLTEAGGKARVLAGGTDLFPELRSGELRPECLVDITRIPDLQGIEIDPDYIRVGAAVTFAEIKKHPFLQEHVPALAQAAASIGVGGIQQTATWSGNIVQGMPAADGIIAALALEAEVLVIDSQGESWEAVDNLFLGPGKSNINPTRELIASIRFPLHSSALSWGTAWRRIGRRLALILPILNCAVKLVLDCHDESVTISKGVLALGPAGTKPFRAKKTETMITGQPADDTLFHEAGESAAKEAHPRTSILRASKEYRQEIIPVLVSEALQEAYHQAWEKTQSLIEEK